MAKYAAIRAISTYLPETTEKNELSENRLEKLGIYERRISSDSETSGDLAVQAAEKLFLEYDIKREDIDCLILCLMHPDYPMPPTSSVVQNRLGLKKSVASFDIFIGCSGYIYGLSVAKGLMETGSVKNVLLLTSNVMTKYINKKDGNMRPLFGDGATATLLTAEDADAPFLHSFVFGTDGSRAGKLGVSAGGCKEMPCKTAEITETDEKGNIHTNFEWHMDGAEVFTFMIRNIPILVEDILNKANLTREDIDYYIFHQTNRYMTTHIQKKSNLDGLPFYSDIEKTGNTVSCTVPIGIEYVLKEKSPKNLKKVMLTGFGVGFSWAGCIADLSQMMPKYRR